MDEGDGTRRGRRRTAHGGKDRRQEVDGDEGDDRKKRERGCTKDMYVCVDACVSADARARRNNGKYARNVIRRKRW